MKFCNRCRSAMNLNYTRWIFECSNCTCTERVPATISSDLDYSQELKLAKAYRDYNSNESSAYDSFMAVVNSQNRAITSLEAEALLMASMSITDDFSETSPDYKTAEKLEYVYDRLIAINNRTPHVFSDILPFQRNLNSLFSEFCDYADEYAKRRWGKEKLYFILPFLLFGYGVFQGVFGFFSIVLNRPVVSSVGTFILGGVLIYLAMFFGFKKRVENLRILSNSNKNPFKVR